MMGVEMWFFVISSRNSLITFTNTMPQMVRRRVPRSANPAVPSMRGTALRPVIFNFFTAGCWLAQKVANPFPA